MFPVSKVLVTLALCVVAIAFAAADAPSFVEVEGPNNNVMSGKPLFVPQIIDIFADDVGATPEEIFGHLKHSVMNQPPSAKLASPIRAEKVDVLEMIDLAEKTIAARKKKAAEKAAKKARAKLAGAAAVKKLKDLAAKQSSRAKAIKSEVSKINSLMSKADQLKKSLPQKRARLDVLKKKLVKANADVAKAMAAPSAGKKNEDAAKKAALALKLKLLRKKLAKVNSAKAVLDKSISGLTKASGKAKKGGKDAAKKGAKKDAKKDAKKF